MHRCTAIDRQSISCDNLGFDSKATTVVVAFESKPKTEGDGGFYFYSYPKSRGFFFKIRQKDAKVLRYIKETLGFGSIYLGKDGYFTYTVCALAEIKFLMNVFPPQPSRRGGR